MNSKKHRLISIVLCVVLVLISSFASLSTVNASTTDLEPTSNEYGLMENIEDGMILHCWCWSFNTIKANLEKIAEAGYTAVQTSPITRCIGQGSSMRLEGTWYHHYQPVDYTIGNYQMGTEAEFKSLCAEADKYGIKVIVDVVANHCSADYGQISDSVKNISGGAFHNLGGGIDYNNRYQVTQRDLLSLKDNNTQNPNVQNMILNFLKQAVADGADGFRYDAAKHIELPDDDSSFAGNFWPTIINNGASFQYGEILQDDTGTDRFAAYSEYMSVTASSYGYILREAVEAKNLTKAKVGSYASKGVDASKLVCWVESHDNYCDQNTWQNITNQEIRWAWAIIAARGDAPGLFFNRPAGSSSSSMWGNNKLGVAGDDNWNHAEVVAVNKFHNAMDGIESSLNNINGDSAVLMIERGTQGAVVINSSTSALNLSSATNLADGTYYDHAHGGTFTVSGGTLTGKVNAGEIAVLYTDNIVRNPSVSISYNGSNEGGDFYDSAEVTLKTSYSTSATYQINSGAKVPYVTGAVITIGSDTAVGQSVTLTLTASNAEGTVTTKSYTFTKQSRPALEGTTLVYYDNSQTNWDTVYIYAYTNNGNTNNGQWPGVPMKELGDNIWGYAIDESWNDAFVIFSNNGSDQNPSGEGYKIYKGEEKFLCEGTWIDYPDPVPTPTTQPSTSSDLYGDADYTGVININDVTMIQKHIAFLTTMSANGYALSDVDSNDKVNIKDATCIQKYLVGITQGIGLVGTHPQ